jgi:metal-dependent HD superfamily phosphatase/phosphodiesterase
VSDAAEAHTDETAEAVGEGLSPVDEERVPTTPPAPATVIREAPELELLRGVDADEAVREAEQVGDEADRRTGTQVELLDRLQADQTVTAFLKLADQFMAVQGFTEHGFRHASLVGRIAYNVLRHLGADEELCELAALAGYLHDVGNVVTRANHGLSSAWVAYDALRRLDVDPYRIGIVMAAVGNHEEQYGTSVGPVAAAVILADKSDVHRSRVREKADTAADIHDRVNFAVTRSFLRVDADAATVTLELELDTSISGLLEYFEIFLDRMIMCRRAARTLGCEFRVLANDIPLF